MRRGKFEYLEDKVEVVNFKTGLIQIDNKYPPEASSSSSSFYDDTLIIAGGAISEDKTGKKKFSKKLHEYNFESGYWYDLGSLPKNGNIKTVMVGQTLYSLIWNENSLGELYSYDLTTSIWNLEIQTKIEFQEPAITSRDGMIYFFENNKFLTFDTKTKLLNSFQINLNLKGSSLITSGEDIYIIGGLRKTEYSITPVSGLFKVNMSEFENTKSKNINSQSY